MYPNSSWTQVMHTSKLNAITLHYRTAENRRTEISSKQNMQPHKRGCWDLLTLLKVTFTQKTVSDLSDNRTQKQGKTDVITAFTYLDSRLLSTSNQRAMNLRQENCIWETTFLTPRLHQMLAFLFLKSVVSSYTIWHWWNCANRSWTLLSARNVNPVIVTDPFFILPRHTLVETLYDGVVHLHWVCWPAEEC